MTLSPYEKIVTDSLEKVSGPFRAYLTHSSHEYWQSTRWSYFAYGYSEAFGVLANEVIRAFPNRDYLMMPLLLLARHSVELSLKSAIRFYSQKLYEACSSDGHSLIQLWGELQRLLVVAGYPIDDDWTVACGKHVDHLHQFDPSGDRFRYPESLKGEPYRHTLADIEGLVTAHANLTLYCEAAESMLDESS
jgi:hypothetical protein